MIRKRTGVRMRRMSERMSECEKEKNNKILDATQLLNRHFLIVEVKQKYFCTVFH